MLVAVSLLFRYEDFVLQIGGTVFHLGLIVGIGTTGAVAMRIFQGVAIDQLGARRIWLACLAIYALSIFWHLWIKQLGVEVFAARILMNSSLAGAFGSSIALVSLRAPAGRVAETVGMLGSSGFVGMAIGPTIGDWLFARDVSLDAQIQSMFYGCLVMIGIAFVCVFLSGGPAVKAAENRTNGKKSKAILAIVRKHHPGFLLVVGIAMGLGISLPHAFLRPYAKTLDIDELKTFFLCYTTVAFVARVMTRKLPDVLGFRWAILVGLFFLAASMPAYLLVTNVWTLAIPATIAGLAHAFLFPAVVASACESFPVDHRGTATSLILGMFDIGVLVGAPLIGSLLTLTRMLEIASYPTMFLTVSISLSAVAIAFYFLGRKSV